RFDLHKARFLTNGSRLVECWRPLSGLADLARHSLPVRIILVSVALSWSLVGAGGRSAAGAPAPVQLPGAEAFRVDLQPRLRGAWLAQASRTTARTTHMNADGSPQYINRLIFSSSPYLQQHAFNPVNWYPWGEEAFTVAQREDRPIFLSIGYSTCHWCHVME